MITDIASYLRFFDSVRRRTERDVAALPPEAAAWRPPAAAGEAAWSIGDIVGHIGGTRLYFASAYRGEGWITGPRVADPADQRTWRFTIAPRSTPMPGSRAGPFLTSSSAPSNPSPPSNPPSTPATAQVKARTRGGLRRPSPWRRGRWRVS